MGQGTEQIVQLKNVVGLDYVPDYIQKVELAELVRAFDKEFYEFIHDEAPTMSSTIYVDVGSYNLKYVKDPIDDSIRVVATDVRDILELVSDYNKSKEAKNQQSIAEYNKTEEGKDAPITAEDIALANTKTGWELISNYLSRKDRAEARAEFLSKNPKAEGQIIEYIKNCSDDERVEIAEFLLNRSLNINEITILLAVHNREPEEAEPQRNEYKDESEWEKAWGRWQLARIKVKTDMMQNPDKFHIPQADGFANGFESKDSTERKILFDWNVCGNPDT